MTRISERTRSENQFLQTPEGMKQALIAGFSPSQQPDDDAAFPRLIKRHLGKPFEQKVDKSDFGVRLAQSHFPFTHALVSLVDDGFHGDDDALAVADKAMRWYTTQCVFVLNSSQSANSFGKVQPYGVFDGYQRYVENPEIQKQLVGLTLAYNELFQTIDILNGKDPDQLDSHMMTLIGTDPPKGPFAESTRLLKQAMQGSPTYDTSGANREISEKCALIASPLLEYIIEEGSQAKFTYSPSEPNPYIKLANDIAILHQAANARRMLPHASIQVYHIPGGRMLSMAGANNDQIRENDEKARVLVREEYEKLRPDTVVTPAEVSTCFRFLFDADDAETMQAKIETLTDSFLLSTQRVYSAGYHVDLTRIHNPYLKSIGMTSLTFRPEGGNIAAGVQFRGQSLKVMLDREGHCAFPQGFSDPVAQANLELIIKAHLVEAMREDKPALHPPDESESQVEGIEGNSPTGDVGPVDVITSQLFRQAAYLKGLPYGDRSIQITDEVVNAEVSTWSGVPFATLNDVFRSIQLLDSFDPINPASYSAFPGYKALPLKAQKLIDAVFGRFPQKISAPTLHSTLKTPEDWSPRLRPSATVERRLLCELAYVKEVKKNLPSEDPIVVDTSPALKHYREILPPTPKVPVAGTVFSVE